MTGPVPEVVVSLPGRTVRALRDEAAAAGAGGADVAEVRVDRLDAGERGRLEDLFPSPLPLLATLRSAAEGGEGPDTPAEREPILERLRALPFRMIDLEWTRDATPTPLKGPKPIFSIHLPPMGAEEWERPLEELARAPGPGKLVFPCGVGPLLDRVAPEVADRRGGDVTVHTTGPSGPLLRAWSRRLGFPYVFAALPEPTPRGDRERVEPAQIPVDRLVPYLRAEGEPPMFAVVGRPIDHSLSPWIHHEWMRANGRVGLYIALELEDEETFLDSLGPLADGGLRGLNVTHPYKSAAFRAATRAGPSATACGAANCLTLRDGEVEAENTDLAAILQRLHELTRERDPVPTVALVGAGGAARATLVAARSLELPVDVFARRADAARELARELDARAPSSARDGGYDLVVHATSVGRGTGSRLEPNLSGLLGPRSHVLDWVYGPDDPVLRRTAEAKGGTYEDGWRLLVYQAAAAYAIWWGSEPTDGQLESVLREGPCAA